MTDHAEISRQLALALGYAPESVQLTDPAIFGPRCIVYGAGSGQPFEVAVINEKGWSVFDYRSPHVAMPLLVWLMKEHGCEPDHSIDERKWYFFAPNGQFWSYKSYADTLEEAIARAVIAIGGK